METNDPFRFIDAELGVVSPVQLATLTNNSLFLNDDHMADDDTEVLMTPADEPILICSLPYPQPQAQAQPQPQFQTQAQSEPATESTPPVIEKEKSLVNVKKEGKASYRKKSKRIQLRSSMDPDEGTESDPAAKITPPPPHSAGTRMLPATLRGAKIEEIPHDPSGKVGSCAENLTLAAVGSPVKVEKEKDLSGKVGSCSGTLTPVVQIKKEKVTIPSGKAPLCSENPPVMDQTPVEQREMGVGQEKEPDKAKTMAKAKGPAKAKAKTKKSERAKAKSKELQGEKKSLSDAGGGSSASKAMPAAAMNLLEALKLLAKPLDKKYEDMDILDICAMKGIHFDPPRWHRPGGYDRKPNSTDKAKK